jgi:hypothetical protein
LPLLFEDAAQPTRPTEPGSTSKKTGENNMQGYGWYFVLVGILGIVTALARAKNEREFFLVLATIPTAFLVVRVVGFLSKKEKK